MGDALDWVRQAGRDEDAFAAIQPLLSAPDSRVRTEATSAIASLAVHRTIGPFEGR